MPFFAHAAEVTTTEKLITVDTGKQMLYAWESGKVQYQTSVSTGLYQTPTVLGTYRIYSKLPVQNMRGVSRVKGSYYLPNVQYVMYFYQGYAIHAAYWHTNFGIRMSNGCVNTPTEAAKWLYDWAPIGTKVIVY
jgi:lipoprotein-anchoring transpeptidase ErfK/SrfK